jgi:hypothetical protein
VTVNLYLDFSLPQEYNFIFVASSMSVGPSDITFKDTAEAPEHTMFNNVDTLIV